MEEEQAAALRAPFAEETIGKLPRTTCRDCSKGNCQKHSKSKCRECNAWISSAHIHLDYVGHAAVTDRLLSVDPEWTWEPLAFDADGVPKIAVLGQDSCLWARFTVCGVTRVAVGTAPSNSFELAKQLISDLIRNGAMRFGVGLDLWSKEDLVNAQTESERVPVGVISDAQWEAIKSAGATLTAEQKTVLKQDCAAAGFELKRSMTVEHGEQASKMIQALLEKEDPGRPFDNEPKHTNSGVTEHGTVQVEDFLDSETVSKPVETVSGVDTQQPTGNTSDDDLDDMRAGQLAELCEEYGLRKAGTLPEIRDRIRDHRKELFNV